MDVVCDALLFGTHMPARFLSKVGKEYESRDLASFGYLSSSLKVSNGGAIFAGFSLGLRSSRSFLVVASAQDPLKANGFPVSSASKFNPSESRDGVLWVVQPKQLKELSSSVLTMLGSGDDGEGGASITKVDDFCDGGLAQDGLLVRQNFVIRSYEINHDQRASFESLMNFSQEVNINLLRSMGPKVSDFGVTPEMRRRNLIWVYSKMQATVDCYPSWGDTVQGDTSLSLLKNSIHFNCLLTDFKTGKPLARASSFAVMINKHTRKPSKLVDATRAEMQPFCRQCDPVMDELHVKLRKLEEGRADFVRKGFLPQWGDLDVNKHVNNVKVIGWILEGLPASVRENHELCAMRVEYRKECGIGSKLGSLSAAANEGGTCYDFDHLLHLENGTEIARAKTAWRPKGKESAPLGIHVI